MNRKTVALLVLAAAILFAVIFAWKSSGGTHRLPTSLLEEDAAPLEPRMAALDDPNDPSDQPPLAYDGAALRATMHDPRVREEMRRRIMEAWTKGQGINEPVPMPPTPMEPMPVRPDGKIDPDYIRQRFREDFLPMAKSCYQELLARDPKAGGQVQMSFTIVADEKIGGVVDQAGIGDGGTLHDEKLDTCMRESLSTMSFRPPPQSGTVTVIYPITLSPDPSPSSATAPANSAP